MSIRKMLFVVLLGLSSACSSDLFLDNNGNMPDKDRIGKIHLGLDKNEVYDILGAPSSVTGLSDDHWIYMSSSSSSRNNHFHNFHLYKLYYKIFYFSRVFIT